jgi:hypothetical protein
VQNTKPSHADYNELLAADEAISKAVDEINEAKRSAENVAKIIRIKNLIGTSKVCLRGRMCVCVCARAFLHVCVIECLFAYVCVYVCLFVAFIDLVCFGEQALSISWLID